MNPKNTSLKTNKSKHEILFVFTSQYPYGKGENFLQTELEVYGSIFDYIYIFPLNTTVANNRPIPKNAEICTNTPISNLKKMGILLMNFPLIFKILLIEFLGTDKKIFFLSNLHNWAKNVITSIAISKTVQSIKSTVSKEKAISYYSFWMNPWALALSILKDQGKIDKFVFRCNGIDIYDERRKGNYMPFRKYNYIHTKYVVPNSKKSASYLLEKNIFPSKIKPFYLGTLNYGLNPFSSTDRFCLVSCGRIHPVKRTHLITEILQHIDFEITWLHIGGEKKNLKAIELLAEKLPSNVKVEFTGYLSTYEEIIDIYKNRSINLFINTSSTEGLPVSIQEAISFGIPTIATDVGGVSEIVNETTGKLISADFQPQEAAAWITAFNNSEKNTPAFRQGVRKFWEENFSAENLYEDFFDFIKQN